LCNSTRKQDALYEIRVWDFAYAQDRRLLEIIELENRNTLIFLNNSTKQIVCTKRGFWWDPRRFEPTIPTNKGTYI